MNITHCIIFSKDRAMQLDATLRSLFRHCKDDHLSSIAVLFKVTTKIHERQYDNLKKAYPAVQFVEEITFRNDFFAILRACFYSGKFSKIFLSAMQIVQRIAGFFSYPFAFPRHIFFIVDDTIFVQDWELKRICQMLDEHPDALGFSLRLGTNTEYCYTLNCPQHIPPHEEVASGIIKFPWVGSDADFGYPLEVSSSVYKAVDIFPLLSSLKFNNPNQLEGQMATAAKHYANKQKFLLSFQQSVAFSVPVNKVQDVNSNHAGVDIAYTNTDLAKMFDQGLRIDVAAFDGFTPSACHQEVPLSFLPLSEKRHHSE